MDLEEHGSPYDVPFVCGHSEKRIVFYDLETTIPEVSTDTYEVLEFAAIVLNWEGLYDLYSYETLIQPEELSRINLRSMKSNGITREMVKEAPLFETVADRIFKLLNGQIWCGHNISSFGNLRLKEIYLRAKLPHPEPFFVVDTHKLLSPSFGARAGNMKLSSLGDYCGLGRQKHRALEDIRRNIEVLKACSTMMLLETSFPAVFASPPTGQTPPFEGHSFPKFGALHISSEQQNTVDSTAREEGSPFPSCAVSESERGPNKTALSESSEEWKTVSLEGLPLGDNYGRPSFEYKGDQIGKMELEVEPEELVSSEVIDFDRDLKGGEMEERESRDGGKIGRLADSRAEKVPRNDSNGIFGMAIPNFFASVFQTGRSEEQAEVAPSGMEEDGEFSFLDDIAREEEELLSNILGFFPGRKASTETVHSCLMADIESRDNGNKVELNEDELFHIENEPADNSKGIAEPSATLSSKKTTTYYVPESWNLPQPVESKDLICSSIQAVPSDFEAGVSILYNGYPLAIRDTVRVRSSVSENHEIAFDANGRPRFNIIVEPSSASCRFLDACDTALEQLCLRTGDLSICKKTLLDKKSMAPCVRLSIAISWEEGRASYKTRFLTKCIPSWQGLFHDVCPPIVDPVDFRKIVPSGSILDLTFSVETFKGGDGSHGVRLVALVFVLCA